jgi:hypothetical protein
MITNIFLRTEVHGDNPILNGLKYEIINNEVQFEEDLATLQRQIVSNIASFVDSNRTKCCNIVTKNSNFPSHLSFLIFFKVVHRYNGVYCDDVLIAQHGPIN